MANNVDEGYQSILTQIQQGSGASTKPDQAFSGFKYGPLAGGRGHSADPDFRGTGIIGSNTRTVQDMMNDYYRWDQAQRDQLRAKLALIDKGALQATDDQLAQKWGDYVQQSANHFAAGDTMTPWDIIARDIGSRSGAGSLAGTKTTTTKDTSLTGFADASAIFRTAAQSLLGRDPTTQELKMFQANLNGQERANPTTATTTTTTDEQGNTVSQSRTSSGGIGAGGAQEIAQEAAKNNPEYGAYQAATTYSNAMLQTIMRGY